MKARAANLFDRMFAIDGTSPADVALLEERIAAIQPRMVWLFLLVAIYFIGVAMVLHQAGWSYLPDLPLAFLIAIRIRYWLLRRRHLFLGEEARRALRGIGLGSMGVATCYLSTLGVAVTWINPLDWQLMLLSASICAIAAAMTIATMMRAGSAVLILLGVPASVLATVSGPNPVASLVGFNLFMCVLLSLYMLRLQDIGFVRQFQLRLDGQAERGRAERAEQRALVERTHARAAAESDFLTGLPNRRAFLAAISNRPPDGTDDTLMVLDLDGFKPVNDIFGHPTGDELLKLVSERLCALSKADTFVARLGGDEFAMIARGLSGEAAKAFAETVIADIGRPYLIGSSTIAVGACCGVAALNAETNNPSNALRQADLALYRAKAIGRGTVQSYERSMGDALRRRSDIERALRKPGIENDIELAFQPIFNLETMEIASFEALARWSHSQLGSVSPSDFIPITEQIQLIDALSEALLIRAVGNAKSWRPNQILSFNLGAVQLCSLGSAERVLKIIANAGFPPERLQIEVTETAMMADFDSARINISALRRAGVYVALDDFGAGFASIGYLRELHFDKLKLDGSLLAACNTKHGAALLEGVIGLARSIGTPCIAEHVETMQEVTLLRTFGCRFGQGFWLGRPVGAREAEALANASFAPSFPMRLAS